MAYISFQPHDFFNTVLYTGNGGNQTINTVGFESDWSWFKSRDAGNSHAVVTREVGFDKVLYPDTNSAQQSISAQTFNSSGYALVQDSGANSINSNGSTKVAWNWKANGAGSTNSDGSVSATVSVNQTTGISIQKWVSVSGNMTFGHGLGVVPKLVIMKSLSNSENWRWGHNDLGWNGYLNLDTTQSKQANTTIWQNQSPSSTVVYTAGNQMGLVGDTIISWCFAEKQGFSKFGKYKGNGNADGPFIYTGFKPGVVIVKNIETTNQWQMFDSKRGRNAAMGFVYPDSAEAETATVPMDIYANGFKFRDTSQARNGNGYDFIFMAFAEEPLVASNGDVATAR